MLLMTIHIVIGYLRRRVETIKCFGLEKLQDNYSTKLPNFNSIDGHIVTTTVKSPT
jgi:hypothetical protein